MVVGVVLLAALAAILAVALPGGPSGVQLASFVGKDRRQAIAAAHRLGVVPKFVSGASAAPEGTVFKQVPGAGTEVEPGSPVILVLSKGPAGSADAVPPGDQPGERPNGPGKGPGTGEGHDRDRGKGPEH